MKWETVTSTFGQSVFALWNNGKKIVTLGLNPSSNAARIDAGDEKRVFLIRKEGLLKNRTVMTNEYGIRIGRAGTEGNQQYIEMNNERFFYEAGDAANSVTIYKESKLEPLAVCELEAPEQRAGARKNFAEIAAFSMLMTVCWYLFQPGKMITQ